MIDFYSSWCGPCKTISPLFEKMSLEFINDIDFYKINVDNSKELSTQFKITAMPTFAAFRKGKKVGEVVGAVESEIKALMVKAKAK